MRDAEEEEEEEDLGEEDSQFMKLAKKVTAKTLQRKGQRRLIPLRLVRSLTGSFAYLS